MTDIRLAGHSECSGPAAEAHSCAGRCGCMTLQAEGFAEGRGSLPVPLVFEHGLIDRPAAFAIIRIVWRAGSSGNFFRPIFTTITSAMAASIFSSSFLTVFGSMALIRIIRGLLRLPRFMGTNAARRPGAPGHPWSAS